MIISIDGPAGSGKSTVAKIVSENLGFEHFNSGLLYRGVTAYLLSINFDFSTITVDSKIPVLNLETFFLDGIQNVLVNSINFTNQLRDNSISVLTPIVSTNKYIREKIDACQRNYASKRSIIVDGRDIGSYVFPNAELKIYLDCSIKERAKRRFLEEQQKGSHITLKEIEKQIEERDLIDKTKKIAPLIVPKGAVIIDSTNLSVKEVVERIEKLARS